MPTGRSKATVTTTMVAWYLSDGDEQCPHCGQLYAYELEFRCPDCDEPSCVHCRSKHADNRWVCVSCVDVADEDTSNG
ncbi:MAG: hypothetical protein ABW171_11775 [Steroidobacter sp.]